MQVTYAPIFGKAPISDAVRYGDTLVFGGTALDLSNIPAGAVLLAPHEFIHRVNRDEEGVLHVTVPRYYLSDPAPDETTEDLPDSGVWENEVTVVSPPPEPTQSEKDYANMLTPAQFTYMLALNGWEETWADAEAYLKASDVAAYARLVAQKSAQTYRLSATLAFIAQMQPVLTAMGSTVDLSEATIRAAWDEAKAALAL